MVAAFRFRGTQQGYCILQHGSGARAMAGSDGNLEDCIFTLVIDGNCWGAGLLALCLWQERLSSFVEIV